MNKPFVSSTAHAFIVLGVSNPSPHVSDFYMTPLAAVDYVDVKNDSMGMLSSRVAVDGKRAHAFKLVSGV